jgi:hypothetical protein
MMEKYINLAKVFPFMLLSSLLAQPILAISEGALKLNAKCKVVQ